MPEWWVEERERIPNGGGRERRQISVGRQIASQMANEWESVNIWAMDTKNENICTPSEIK